MRYRTLTIEGDGIKALPDVFKEKYSPGYTWWGGSENLRIFVLERFKLRQGFDLAVTVIFSYTDDDKGACTVVVAGGRAGFLRVDPFGAEESLTKEVSGFIRTAALERGWKCF